MRNMQSTNGGGRLRVPGHKPRAGVPPAALLGAVLLLAVLTGCQNPMQQNEPPTEGRTGTLSLTIERQGVGRTILPDWPENVAKFRLDFEPSNDCDTVNDPKPDLIWRYNPVDGEVSGTVADIPAGLWDLSVTAYVPYGSSYRPIAEGRVEDSFRIYADEETLAGVTLRPLRDGVGTFRWNISIPDGLNLDEGWMEISDADENQAAPERLYFEGGTPTIDLADERPMPAGQYRVVVMLRGDLGETGTSAAMRIYRYMESRFIHEFTLDCFLNDPLPESVAVSPATASVYQGQTHQFGATVSPAWAPQLVTWTIEPGTAGTISGTGYFTLSATATGTVTVRATAAGTDVYGTATVTVIPTPTWAIELDAPATHAFDALTEGYTADEVEALLVTVENTGNQATGELSVALSGDNPDAFTLTGSPIDSIAVGETGTFTVRPALGLAVGTHTATVTVSGGNDISESFYVSFEVSPHICVWGEWIVTIPATCITDGEETRTCTIDPAHYQTRTIPALGHQWGAWIIVTDPTATQDGLERRECLCDCCDQYQTRIIPALDHSCVWGYWIVTTPATCVAEGEETRTCTIDPAHTETRPIAALGHDWSGWIVTTPATCTTAAMETRTCARCDTQETRPGAPALGYQWGAWVETTAPTCTVDGVQTRTCQICNTATQTQPIPALNHDWGGWSVTIPPTGTQPGVETRTCARSGTTETREIPALGQGTAPFTISWREFADMAEGAIITAPNLSYFDLRAGTPVVITIEDPDNVEFANIRWFFGGSEITGSAVSNNGATLTLSPQQVGFGIGPRNVAVRVYVVRDGGATVPYGRVITFSVTL